jgi:hypothetical protein
MRKLALLFSQSIAIGNMQSLRIFEGRKKCFGTPRVTTRQFGVEHIEAVAQIIKKRHFERSLVRFHDF